MIESSSVKSSSDPSHHPENAEARKHEVLNEITQQLNQQQDEQFLEFPSIEPELADGILDEIDRQLEDPSLRTSYDSLRKTLSFCLETYFYPGCAYIVDFPSYWIGVLR
ncbi:hypothetical protein SI65_07052 [Aspergillus cristatus]|uniref:Uncharacterized protein n=1 Tax=Aspergillus cristatus TaxID=573508 RepID=A0A1E3B8V3_ASPCR|nr:hypothetical protein SI65_07052 [Aspergillus cristatus]